MDENLSAKVALFWFPFVFALFVPVEIALVREDFAAIAAKKLLLWRWWQFVFLVDSFVFREIAMTSEVFAANVA